MIVRMFRAAVRTWRAFRGRCPYCGGKLEFQRRRRSREGSGNSYGSREVLCKLCVRGHFGIEYLGDGKLLYHDDHGALVELFYDKRLKLLKGRGERRQRHAREALDQVTGGESKGKHDEDLD